MGDGGNREGAYVPWLEPQPEWSAFRESTFGVGFLTFYNATHAWYNWTRNACFSPDGGPEQMDFSDGCSTVSKYGVDNSEDPTADTDGVWIVRASDRRCGTAPAACDRTPIPRSFARSPPAPDGPNDAPSSPNGLSFDAGGRAAAAIVGFLLGAVAVASAWVCSSRRSDRPSGSDGGKRKSSAGRRGLPAELTPASPPDSRELNQVTVSPHPVGPHD